MKRAGSSKLLFLLKEYGALLLVVQKVNKQVRLMERKVCFISDASIRGGGEGRYLAKSWLSPNWEPLRQEFYRQKKAVTCRKVTVSSDQFSSVQSLSHVRLFAIPWITVRQASLSITKFRSLLKLMSIESVMPSSHLILCHPLLLLLPIPPSIRVFSNESTLCMRWPKYWSFSFSICSSNEQPGLISFRMDWLDLLAVQGTLKSLLQHHSSKTSILRHSAFFTVQLSHP